MGEHLFEYAVVRVVPRVERGEFVNIGVVVYCRAVGFLAMRTHLDTARLCMLCATLDMDELHEHVQAFERICRGDASAGPIASYDIAERFRWLTAVRSTIVQCSDVHSGLCSDPAATLDHLFATLVL